MKKLNKAAKGLSKVCEVLCWVGDAALLVMLIVLGFARTAVTDFIQSGLDSGSLTITGADFTVLDANGNLMTQNLVVAFIGGIIVISLVAMMFRNVYLIFKKSETETPFAKDNIRMVREIGIFAIAIPVVQLIASIAAMIFGAGSITISINPFIVVFGIIMLCLSQFFAYGASLEHDVEGLV